MLIAIIRSSSTDFPQATAAVAARAPDRQGVREEDRSTLDPEDVPDADRALFLITLRPYGSVQRASMQLCWFLSWLYCVSLRCVDGRSGSGLEPLHGVLPHALPCTAQPAGEAHLERAGF